MSPEFLVTALIVVIIPGTGVLFTVATGLTHGGRASLAAACGCTLGILPHIAASLLGLAAVLHASAVAFQAVKLAGVAYLLYLAWGMWRDGASAPVATLSVNASNNLRIAFKGFTLNILNPKLSVFFLAFLPQFVRPQSAAPIGEMIFLSAVFMAMTLVVFILYGLMAGAVRQKILDRARTLLWIRRIFATAFATLGVKLALTDR